MPSPTRQSRRISHDNPDLLTRAGPHQSHSPVSTDKTLCLSSKILLSPLSHLFSCCPPSPQSWLTSKETEPARPARSSHGGSDARVHAPQPASQPAGRVGSLLGPSCWAEMGADRGLQGRESGRADKTRGAQSLWGKPKPAGSQASSSRGVSPCGHPGGRPRLGPAGPLLSSLSWLRPKPGSLGIPWAAKRALRVFPNPHCLMRSWKTWIFAFYTFAVDHIQVTA